ncbi:MAG: glycosyltransferase family 2 protein [Peptococcaceae bacterium]|nr:glycosyltransferase family 2 protein [Peptococcaceae bacterium]
MTLEISVVIPVYKSEASLDELYERLTRSLQQLTNSYEIILVNDCSPDKSWAKLKELSQRDNRVKTISLMRNFGQHNAIMCGFNYAQGDYVLTMDDDLQNPPEEIQKLVAKMAGGYDAVIGRPYVKKHAAYRNFGSYIIGKSLEGIFGKPKDIKMSSFRLLRKSLVQAVISVKTPNPMIDALILSNTLNIANVEVTHDARKYGKTNYSLYKSSKLAYDLLVNYSTIPLRFISINGFVFAALGLLIGAYVIVGRMLGSFAIAGWASTIALLSIFSGLILVSFGVVGEYLSRIISEVAYFRQYVIRESSYAEELPAQTVEKAKKWGMGR